MVGGEQRQDSIRAYELLEMAAGRRYPGEFRIEPCRGGAQKGGWAMDYLIYIPIDIAGSSGPCAGFWFV